MAGFMKKNNCRFSALIQAGAKLKSQLMTWVVVVNSHDIKKLKKLYAQKAKIFSTFNGVKNSSEEIEKYFKDEGIYSVEIDEHSLSFDTSNRSIEGEYRLIKNDQSIIQANFSFQFDENGKITEQASAPKNIRNWKVKNEVSVGVLLTSITVKSVLKRSGAIKTPDCSNPQIV